MINYFALIGLIICNIDFIQEKHSSYNTPLYEDFKKFVTRFCAAN